MIGIDALMALRRTGRKPRSVSVSTAEAPHPRLAQNIAEMNDVSGGGCHYLAITPDKPVSRLDLRALQGLLVMVDGTDSDRVDAVSGACIQAGAARVIASVYRINQHGICITERMTDTEGVIAHGELPA